MLLIFKYLRFYLHFHGIDALLVKAFDAGVKVIGITVHFVDEGMDTGPIIDQQAIRIEKRRYKRNS